MGFSWSNLPSELIVTISESITTISDYLRFRSVCSAWRSATAASPRHLPVQLPWLCFRDPFRLDSFAFYPGPNSKLHAFAVPTNAQEFLGYSNGRLILKSRPDGAITIFNPLTCSHTHLPLFHSGSIHRVVISPPPDSSVLVITDRLLLHRLDRVTWTAVNGSHRIANAVFFNGRIYAIGNHNNMLVYDADGSLMEDLGTVFPWNHEWSYFVEFEDHLLVVSRRLNSAVRPNDLMKDGFEVYRLETENRSDGRPLGMVRLDGLGDLVMFVGFDGAVLLLEEACPAGFKRNCIYFPQTWDGREMVAVFHMYDGRFDFLPYRFDEKAFQIPQRTFWFTPNLC